DGMHCAGNRVGFDGMTGAHGNSCADGSHGAHCVLHAFECGAKIGAGLRFTDRCRQLVDRRWIFTRDAIEYPRHATWFAECFDGGRIISALSCSKLLRKRVAPADELVERGLMDSVYCRLEVGRGGGLGHRLGVAAWNDVTGESIASLSRALGRCK